MLEIFYNIPICFSLDVCQNDKKELWLIGNAESWKVKIHVQLSQRGQQLSLESRRKGQLKDLFLFLQLTTHISCQHLFYLQKCLIVCMHAHTNTHTQYESSHMMGGRDHDSSACSFGPLKPHKLAFPKVAFDFAVSV